MYRCGTKHEIPAAQNRAFLKQISSKKVQICAAGVKALFQEIPNKSHWHRAFDPIGLFVRHKKKFALFQRGKSIFG
jgi:hypothetical protein